MNSIERKPEYGLNVPEKVAIGLLPIAVAVAVVITKPPGAECCLGILPLGELAIVILLLKHPTRK